jgi:hypothetical protein
MYTAAGIEQLAAAVNARLRARQPEPTAEQDRARAALRKVRQRFEGVRRFVEQENGSPKVRHWLAELEQEEERLEASCGVSADDPSHKGAPGSLSGLSATIRKPSRNQQQKRGYSVCCNPVIYLVAGAGFEPATFGL